LLATGHIQDPNHTIRRRACKGQLPAVGTEGHPLGPETGAQASLPAVGQVVKGYRTVRPGKGDAPVWGEKQTILPLRKGDLADGRGRAQVPDGGVTLRGRAKMHDRQKAAVGTEMEPDVVQGRPGAWEADDHLAVGHSPNRDVPLIVAASNKLGPRG